MSDTFYTNVCVSGGKILFRGYEKGKRVSEREVFGPSLFIPTNKPTKFSDIRGNPVEEVKFNTINDAKKFVKTYSQAGGMEIHGNENWQYQYIASLFPNHEDCVYDASLIRLAFIDIETECENGFPSPEIAQERINVISITCGDRKWVLATGRYELPANDHLIQFCDMTEEQLLLKFYDIIDEIDPDVISGWSIKFFDIPYIINRTRRVLDGIQNFSEFPDILSGMHASRLSPWRQVREREVEKWQKISKVYALAGRDILDYLELYRKYVLEPRESYKLDHIAEAELGRKKVDYSEYGSFREFYKQNFQKFVEYNLEDTILVQDIDKKRNLINLQIMMAYMAKVNYEDVFSQVKTWDAIIYNHLNKKNIVIPPKSEKGKEQQYTGAFVKEPVVGLHEWIVSFDAVSLYPSLIRFCGISPDSILDAAPRLCTIDQLLEQKIDLSELHEKHLSMAANGHHFKKEVHGFMPELMTIYFESRKKYKKLAGAAKKQIEKETDPERIKELKIDATKYDTMQNALKIALNSCYGAAGSPAFRYYDERLAEAITKSGQLVIQWIAKDINLFLNKLLKTEKTKNFIIYNDTDSMYINLADLVKALFVDQNDKSKIVEFLSKFCEKQLNEVISASVLRLQNYLNGFPDIISMNREVIADRGLWKAKKMYCLNVHDSEGVRYAEPKLKIMGIESQRASTPQVCRTALKECVKIILTGSEQQLIEYVSEFKKKFMALPAIKIAMPRSANNLIKYADKQTIFRKGTPIAVKASLLYNHWIKENNLGFKYQLIDSGDKIKFLHLISQNPIRDKVIAFPGDIPVEMNIEKYVDRHTQYVKTFESALLHLTKVINWSITPKSSLEDLFA